MRASLARRIGYWNSKHREERLRYKMFENMAEIIPEGKEGDAEIVHFQVSEDDARATALRALLHGDGDEIVHPGRYCKLKIGDSLVMTDTEMERRSNLEIVTQARGNVLIAGLGLGMILVPILKKKEVEKVTVVEKNKNVLSLVAPHIYRHMPSLATHKLRVVNDDIFEWVPVGARRSYDVIYFDIWSTMNTDNLADMTKLRRRFAWWLKAGGWSGCWYQEELRARKRREG